MDHSQDGKPASDEELGRAVDELEELVPAVAERARQLHAKLASRWA